MSDASSKLQSYLKSPQAGALALLEFLAAGLAARFATVLYGQGGRGAAVLFNLVSVTALGCFMVHTLVVIKRRRWDPWFTLLAVLLFYFLAQAFAGLLVSLYPALKGWSLARITLWLDNSVKAQSAYFALTAVFSLAAVFAYLRNFRIKLPAIGLRRPRWSDLGYGLLAAPLYYAFYVLAVAVISWVVPGLDIDQSQKIGFEHVSGVVSLSLAFVSLVILPPLTEEIMMRGLLYGGLRQALPVVWAAMLTSGLFALAHLPEGGAGGPLYIAAIDTFILSLVLVYLREKTGGLWSCITLHATKNAVAFVALFVINIR